MTALPSKTIPHPVSGVGREIRNRRTTVASDLS